LRTDAAATAGADLTRALETFRRLDLVHVADGEIAVVYPFSGCPTAHRVSIDGRPEVYAMCAIDALGIAAMLELPIEVLSRDPVNGGEVWVRVDPGVGAWWDPEQAVVLAVGCARVPECSLSPRVAHGCSARSLPCAAKQLPRVGTRCRPACLSQV
jgi:hypothetical protein